MGRRSDFVRIDKDKYNTTDKRAVPPLLKHLNSTTYIELCAGKGDLIDLLTRNGLTCVYACDKYPDDEMVIERDALTIKEAKYQIISNPPWKRKLLHPLIKHFITLGVDVWLLFDAGWLFTEQAAPYLKYCHKVIAVPRLQWFPGTEHDAQDDCAWYLFKSELAPNGGPIFINERK